MSDDYYIKMLADYIRQPGANEVRWDEIPQSENALFLAQYIVNVNVRYRNLLAQVTDLKAELAMEKRSHNTVDQIQNIVDDNYPDTKRSRFVEPPTANNKSKAADRRSLYRHSTEATVEQMILAASSLSGLGLSTAATDKLRTLVVDEIPDLLGRIPYYPVYVGNLVVGQRFKETFFANDTADVDCNTWLEAMVARVIIKSLAANTLVDNTEPFYTEFMVTLTRISQGIIPDVVENNSYINAMLSITNRVVAAILKLDVDNDWLYYYYRQNGYDSMTVILSNFLKGFRQIYDAIISGDDVDNSFRDLRFVRAMWMLGYSQDIQLPPNFMNTIELAPPSYPIPLANSVDEPMVVYRQLILLYKFFITKLATLNNSNNTSGNNDTRVDDN